MEYKAFLKKHLLNNGYGIYGKILEVYREQMEFLGTPSRFRSWLADELEVAIEKINLSSLNSALQQQRKKNKQTGKQQQPASTSSPVNPSENKKGGFKFSKPSSDDKKEPRIIEM